MKIVIELKDKKDVGELLWVLEQGGLAVEYDWNPLAQRSPRLKTSKAQKQRTKSVIKRVTPQLFQMNIRTIDNQWEFKYEEEIFDSWGMNLMGVLTNGTDCLFYHVIPERDGGPEYCYIYSSIQCMMQPDCHEVSYPWTMGNDQKVLDALNSLQDHSRLCGENCILREIKFDSYDKSNARQ